MAVKPVVYDDSTKKHRPLGSGEKMDGLSASSLISSQSGNLITAGSDGLVYATGSGIADPAADNLLEATSGGKLKVDIDRIIEWLDGHPADAKDAADAINVVSSDSGNIISKGTDKGALLTAPSASSALADGTTITASGGKLHAVSQSGDASQLADGRTIVAQSGKLKVNYGPGLSYDSQSGKLIVVFNDLTPEQILALCKPHGGISGDAQGLFVDFSELTAAQILALCKPNGGISADSQGLYVDFGELTAEQVLALCKTGGGISGDDEGLYVDFGSMPTDKFDKMMADLRMLSPLEGNLTVFVNPSGTGAADPGIGVPKWGLRKNAILNPDYDSSDPSSQQYLEGPFASISGAVNYITSKYSVGNYHVTIRVVAGTYNENVRLPGFSYGTGYIEIRSDSSNLRDVTVVAQASTAAATAGSVGWCFNAGGGNWRLRHISAVRVEQATKEKGQAFGCYNVTNGGRLLLYGCSATQSFSANFPDAEGENNRPYEIRLFCADSGAELRLQHDELPGSISSAVNTVDVVDSGTNETSTVNDSLHRVYVFSINRGASLWLTGAYDDDVTPNTTGVFNCSGAFDSFLMLRQNAGVTVYGGGTLTSFAGTVSGKRYALYGGSYVAGSDRIKTDPENQYFPGDEAGTFESSSCCWYHE